jgi:ABC-2 type transport system permease protein
MTGVKKKSFLILVAILCILGFFSMPVMLIIGNIKSGKEAKVSEISKSAIETVYVYDDTDLLPDYNEFKESGIYSDVSFISDSNLSYDDAVESLKENSDRKDLVVKTEYDEKEGFDVTIIHSSKSGLNSSDLDRFEDDFKAFYRDEVLKNLGVSETDYENLAKDIYTEILKIDENGNISEDTSRISLDDYFMLLGGLMMVFMFINMSAGNVSTSIATEKSSRVIEFLLTETRPLALMAGKIAARLLESVITIFASYSCYMLSQLVCLFLIDGNTTTENVSSNVVDVSSIWGSITLSKVLIAVIYCLVGLVLYSILGAITGASVSKLEELTDASKAFAFIMVACVYFDMFLVILMLSTGSATALQYFCAVFPFTGAFLTPALVLTGKISTLTGLIALLILIATTVVAFILASAVYESMLLFQGKRLKMKDVISLMKKQVVV